MNAKEVRKFAETRNDPKVIADQIYALLSCCYDKIQRAAENGRFSVVSPLNDLLNDYPLSSIKAVEEKLRNEGFGIVGYDEDNIYIHW
jgi:hypothetical protein